MGIGELTERTRALIEELHALPKRRFGLVRKRNVALAKLLWRIADASEPAVLPEILSLVLEKHEPVARAAAKTVAVLLAVVPVNDLPQLDEQFRHRSTWWGGWWGIAPRDLSTFDRFGDCTAALLQLATMHPSGFIREQAVRVLYARNAAGSIPFLLIRRNDWVAQVRSAAVEALDASVAPENADQLVQALPLVHRLKRGSRADHGPFIDRVNTLLRQPSCEGALISGTRSADPMVRRACFSIALESPSSGLADLPKSGLQDRDPIVRLVAAGAAVRITPVDLKELLDRMEKDPFAPVRQTGLDARVALFPDDAEPTYQRHLLDRSPSIRAQSQRALNGGSRLPDAIYREEIGSGRTKRLHIALLGLAEVGNASDAQMISTYLNHGSARVRASAVRAVAKLKKGDRDLVPVLFAALQDSSPRVSREARTAFGTRSHSFEADGLWELVERAGYPHVRLNALSLESGLAKWTRLQFLLRACTASDTAVAERAVVGVMRWLHGSNRVALSPNATEVSDTARLLSDARERLPEKIATELAFMLRTTR